MAKYAKYGSGKEIDMWIPKLHTWREGKFHYTEARNKNTCSVEELRKTVPLGLYIRNRIKLKWTGGIISPFYMGDYAEFLQTEEWKWLRNLIMDMNNGSCILCKKRAHHIHHRTYQFGWLPEMEIKPPKEQVLWPLCRVCHMIEHIDELVRFA
jgi:5-methylcytosine-specific restriction endonuclease McrA